MKEFSTKEFAAELKCSPRTVENWRSRRNGKLMPDHTDEHGQAVYTEAQLETARALLNSKFNSHKNEGATTYDTALANLPKPSVMHTRDILAETAGVSSRTMGKVQYLNKMASQEIRAALESGKLSIDAAYNAVKSGATTLEDVRIFKEERKKIARRNLLDAIEMLKTTAHDAQIDAQAANQAVDEQTPADVQNAVKIDDSASIDTREDFAEASPTLVEENLAPVTIDVEAEIRTLDQRADRIRKLAADVTRGIIEIGNELIAAKAEIGHGNFTEWLKENFDWTDRTAQNFMRVAERFGKTENFFGFKPSTLIQMLALPVGSEDEFIAQQAEEGKPVGEMSTREVKDAVKEFNQRNGGLEENFGLVQSAAPETNENTSDIPETNSPAEADDSAADMSQKKRPPRGTASGNHYEAWHTPKEIIDAARRVLGDIDLDPASNPKANEVIGAKVFYTKEDDGLSQEWYGRIWLNPPYSNKPPFENSVIQRFANKLAESNFEAAIVLVNNSTETQFFQTFAQFSDAICFTDRRVNFLHGETDKAGRSGCGSAIFYYGRDVEKFCDEFSAFGWLAEFKRPSRKKNKPDDAGRKDLL